MITIRRTIVNPLTTPESAERPYHTLTIEIGKRAGNEMEPTAYWIDDEPLSAEDYACVVATLALPG